MIKIRRKKHEKLTGGKGISRRRVLSLGTFSCLGLGVAAAYQAFKQSDPSIKVDLNLSRDFTISGDNALSTRSKSKGLLYGAALQAKNLMSDPDYAAKAIRECGIIVPENDLKWGTLRPSRNEFNFRKADWLLELSRQHHIKFRGHTLVWHPDNPSWLREEINHRNAEQLLVEHINTVVKRYAGKIHSWDVVNEAINLYDDLPGGLRRSVWYENLGADYIDIAFRAAANADPDALLVYNDFGIEADYRQSTDKRRAVLELLERSLNRGVPIQALGIQGHLKAEERLDRNQLQSFLKDVASLGLKILITELDVTDQTLPAEPKIRDRIVAGIYEDFLSVVLEEPAVIAVLTWGLSDRYTWLSDYKPRDDGAAVRPLPLDDKLNRKLAWNAIARAFDQSPKR